MSQVNWRHVTAETSQSVHCMQCQTVRSLACFVGMSWRAKSSDIEFHTEIALMVSRSNI